MTLTEATFDWTNTYDVIGLILMILAILLLIALCILMCIYQHKLDQIRADYIKQLNDHDKAIICEYKHLKVKLKKENKK